MTSRVPATVRDAPDGDVPAVPRGTRPMTVVWAAVGLLGAAALGLGAMGANHLGTVVGVGEQVQAVVVERELVVDPPKGCHDAEYVVEWGDGRRGELDTCPAQDAWAVQEGETLEVRILPWSDEVVPASQGADVAWEVVLLGGGLVLMLRGPQLARRWWRAGRPGRGPGFSGRVIDSTEHSVVVEPDEPRPGPVLVLMAGTRHHPSRTGDQVQVWATGRTWLRRRPRGPWVLRSGGSVSVWSPGWWRRR